MEEDTSTHICLICNQTIIGLMNYVDHFKSHSLVTSPKAKMKEESVPITKPISVDTSTNTSSNVTSTSSLQTTVVSTSTETDAFIPAESPITEFINETPEFSHSEIDSALLSPKYCADFFQSLELKSIADDGPSSRPKVKTVQKKSILEDDAHAETLLPITAILSNLDFSSDDEEFGQERLQANDADQDWLSDEERSHLHPPHDHTGQSCIYFLSALISLLIADLIAFVHA